MSATWNENSNSPTNNFGELYDMYALAGLEKHLQFTQWLGTKGLAGPWNASTPTNTISFECRNQQQLHFDMELLGSEAQGTWLWAWANPSFDAHNFTLAQRLKDYGQQHHIPELTEPGLSGMYYHQMGQFASGMTGFPYYIANENPTVVFLIKSCKNDPQWNPQSFHSIFDHEETNGAKFTSFGLNRYLTMTLLERQFNTVYQIRDQRRAIASYLQQNGDNPVLWLEATTPAADSEAKGEQQATKEAQLAVSYPTAQQQYSGQQPTPALWTSTTGGVLLVWNDKEASSIPMLRIEFHPNINRIKSMGLLAVPTVNREMSSATAPVDGSEAMQRETNNNDGRTNSSTTDSEDMCACRIM